MELTFHNNYKEESDKEIVEKIITVPYNEEAAAYLLYNRYDPLLFKLYRKIFDKNLSWYDDCLGDLFDYLKGKNQDWNKLRTFEWRCNFGPWLGRTANNRFLEIKPYLIGKIQNSISIDDDEDRTPVQLPDNGFEDRYAAVIIYILIRVSNPVVLICYEEVLKGAFRQCIYCSILLSPL